MGDDAGGRRHHVGGHRAVHDVRLGHLFPDDDLRPGAVEIDRHPAQRGNAEEGLLADHLFIDGRAVGAHSHPLAVELGEDDSGGHGAVAGDLDGQNEPGQHAHRRHRQSQPGQEGVPPAEFGQEKGNSRPAGGLGLAHHLLRQGPDLFGVLSGEAQPQRVVVQPFQTPEGHRVLGAQVEEPLGESPRYGVEDAAPEKVDDLLHGRPPMPNRPR